MLLSPRKTAYTPCLRRLGPLGFSREGFWVKTYGLGQGELGRNEEGKKGHKSRMTSGQMLPDRGRLLSTFSLRGAC